MRSQRFQGINLDLTPCLYSGLHRYWRGSLAAVLAITCNPNSPDMTIAACIIALNPENPVAIELQRYLREQGFETFIRDAVDGRKEMPTLQGQEQLSQHKALIYRRAELTTTEVGCYLSHYRAIRDAYDTGLSHVCVFEEDIVAEPGLGDVIRDIAQLDESAHLVRLMLRKVSKRKIVKQLPSGYTLASPVRGALGAQGYVVNRAGMKKILDFGATIYMPIDKLYDSFFLYGLNCFTVEPHPVYELMRPTSVRKPPKAKNLPIHMILRWHLHRLERSFHRRVHYALHFSRYFPAAKPKKALGKSQKIR